MAERGMLLEAAKRMVEAAEKKAIEINVPMVITVCDMGGNLVLLHRMEDSLLASLEIAQNKAYTAVASTVSRERFLHWTHTLFVISSYVGKSILARWNNP